MFSISRFLEYNSFEFRGARARFEKEFGPEAGGERWTSRIINLLLEKGLISKEDLERVFPPGTPPG